MNVKKINNFDSYEELKKLNLNRLFILQKTEIDNIRHYLNNYMYDKNVIFNKLEEISIINLVITKKINSYEKEKKYL